MLDSHIYAKIREYVTANLESVQLNGLCLNDLDLTNFTSILPLLSPLQIRTICKAQEQTVSPISSRSFKRLFP